MTRRIDDDTARRLLALGAEDERALDFGKYEVVREVGRGGMGIVYEANDTRLGRRVALKLLGERAGFSSTSRQRFAREAAAVARLNHPNIAQVYDATPDWIAMQFVDGVRLLECGADTRGFARLVRDAARAVQVAHEHGIVHRDLKPSNLLVQDGHVYVVDFGLAKETELDSSLSMTGSVLGTPAFMPPEQAQGRTHDVDERSDVYSLGATLYHCVAGHPPFEADDLVELLRDVVERDVPRVPGIDTDLDTIARKALAKEPSRRYASAAQFADDIDRWLDGRPIVARPPSLGYVATRFAKRHRVALRAIAIVLVLAIGITAAIVVAEQSRRRAMQDALEVSNRITHLLADAEDHRRAMDPDAHRRLLLEAEQRCRDLVARADIAQAHYLLGRVLRRSGGDRFREALASLDRALELDPAFDDARFERGLLLAEFGDKPHSWADSLALGHYRGQAAQDLTAALDRLDAPTPTLRESLSLRAADVLYGRGRLALLRDERDVARSTLEQLLALDPGHVLAYRLLAPLVDDDARRRFLQARWLDLERGFVVDRQLPLIGSTRPWRDDGMLVDLPSVAGDLPKDVLSHAHAGLQHVLRGDALASQGMEGIAVSEYVAGLDDLDFALMILGADEFAPAWNNRAVAQMRLARLETSRDDGDSFRVFGRWVAALSDLDAALASESEFGFALANRAVARRAIASQHASGGLEDLARGGFAAAANDAEHALAVLPDSWRGAAAIRELVRECRSRSE